MKVCESKTANFLRESEKKRVCVYIVESPTLLHSFYAYSTLILRLYYAYYACIRMRMYAYVLRSS
jgi:hypothetical protein